MKSIIFKYLGTDDIGEDILDNFDRTQHVNRMYVMKDGEKVLTDGAYTDDWDMDRKRQVVHHLKENIETGGCVAGAYKDNSIIGFCSLGRRLGKNNDYINLAYCHVDKNHRNLGIGKKLFSLCIDFALKTDARKIYISANDSYETQKFYESVGCTLAAWIDEDQIKREPWDIQMEYVL